MSFEGKFDNQAYFRYNLHMRLRIFRRLKLRKIVSVGFFALILFCCIYFFSVKFLENSAYDTMVKLSANKTGADNIVNVVIDDESIKEVGAWPWKRTLYADMFEYLYEKGAKVIIFDAVLSSQVDKDDDELFLQRIENIPFLIGGVDFTKNENVVNSPEELEYFENKFSVKLTDNRNDNTKQKSQYIAYNELLRGYISAISSIGSVNTALSSDGAVRAFEPFIYMEGEYYPSLSMAAYMKLNDIKEVILYNDSYEAVDNNGQIYKFPLTYENDKSVQYIKWLAPHDKESWIPHEQIKASDIIKSANLEKEGQAPVVPIEKIKDKIIVVGATANALYDLKITPMSINMPGSTIQATILDNLISNDSIFIVPFYINILVILIFAGIIFTLI